MYKIVRKIEIVPNIHLLEIEAPRIAEKAKPGQFVIIIPDDTGERVPFTISDWDTESGTITTYFLEVGLSTMKLASLKTGDNLYGVVGPLGKPTLVDNFGTVVLGGGCYGIGAIYPIAKALKNMGNHVISIIEARSKYLLYLKDELKNVSDQVLVGTMDGSQGTKGYVHNIIENLLKKGEKIDLTYFAGCTFMMMNCSNMTKPYNVKTMVCLNSIMVDGTGMCGCCRVSINGKTRFACVDGPEFDGHLVDWEQLFQRKDVYLPEEALAYQYHTPCKALQKFSEEG